MHGVAHHNRGDSKPPRKTSQGAQVVAGIALAFEGEDGLGGEAQFVGDGYADALRAEVEGEIARLGRKLQGWGPPATSLKPGAVQKRYTT